MGKQPFVVSLKISIRFLGIFGLFNKIQIRRNDTKLAINHTILAKVLTILTPYVTKIDLDCYFFSHK